MTALEGSFKTPVGEVPKKAAVFIGGGLLLLVGLMYWRGRNTSTTPATQPTGDIDPATGYVYGTPEDLAALAAQGGAIGAVGGSGGSGGGGGTGGNVVGAGFTNNAEWVQSTIAGMTNSGIVEDASALSVALGKYIAGQPVGDNTTMRSLIEQAIAFNGQPPVAGPNGYPPSINTQNPNPAPADTPAPTTLPTSATAPAGKNLYDWVNEQGVSFIAVFGDEHGTGALNPGARKLMHWDNSTPKIPTFSSPQLLRIR